MICDNCKKETDSLIDVYMEEIETWYEVCEDCVGEEAR